MNLRQQVGQLLIAGVEGPELNALERAWWKLVQPSGVILFRRNIEQASQVVSLLSELASLTKNPQLRCIDLEGGLVDRLRDLIAPMPSPAAVFATGKRTNYVQHGRLIGREARILGFNTVFAPALDLGLPASAPVMKTRVVSPEPDAVVAYADAFLDGLAAEHVSGCGKHFPGLGGGTLDSHEAMPMIERSWNELWSQDLAVYRALATKLPIVMISHAAYPKIKGKTPASISPFWITEVLKERVGFRGLVLSDDMEMGGILTQTSIEEAAVLAIAAGTDVIEICKDPALILSAYESLLREAERSEVFRKRIDTAARKVVSYKKKHLPAGIPRVPAKSLLARLQADIQKFAQKVAA
jgi:beta-N-acetylhexosaminidase